jgi:CarD family transcriptional regulator, regulator of rRNA transcription
MTFQVGEKVVYPNHGVATIENISTRSFGSRFERFYLLRVSCTNMTVMVPFSHVGEVGLRKVTRNGDVVRVLCFLASGKCKMNQDWKVRFKENSEKMRSGSLLEIAEVMKCLLIIQIEKPLSFREKKMLDRCRQMILTEICISRGLSEGDAIRLLDSVLEKSALRMPEAL